MKEFQKIGLIVVCPDCGARIGSGCLNLLTRTERAGFHGSRTRIAMAVAESARVARQEAE